jgi:hypothetical protein
VIVLPSLLRPAIWVEGIRLKCRRRSQLGMYDEHNSDVANYASVTSNAYRILNGPSLAVLCRSGFLQAQRSLDFCGDRRAGDQTLADGLHRFSWICLLMSLWLFGVGLAQRRPLEGEPSEWDEGLWVSLTGVGAHFLASLLSP